MYPAQPFVRFLIPLVAGILTNDFLNDRHWVPTSGLSFFLCGIIVVCIGLLVHVTRQQKSGTPIVVAALFCLGMLTTTLKNGAFQKQIVPIENEAYDACILKIASLGEKRKTTIRYDALAMLFRVNGHWQTSKIRVVLSLADQSQVLAPGTQILVQGRLLQRPTPPRNPDEFDYQKYLERRGVAWTMYLPEGSWTLLPADPPKGVGTWPQRFSAWADAVLRATLKTQSSYGLVKAMVLARRDDLGADLLNAYIQAGAVHVLAVSGLHVGILFLLLSRLLSRWRKDPWGRFGYLGVIVLFLTFYALITGLSPSVVRASLMCVVFALSQAFHRRHDGINTLAISAFIILLFDPLALFAVGFQLSYAAVLGILLFYPLVNPLADSKVLAVQWLIQITGVSLAAQVFTFPLSIYYFHQFPTYFWLVNPFVIGLTPVLIYSTLAMLSIQWLPFTPMTNLLAYWTDGVAQGMNRVVELPKRLPHYLLENLDFDFLEIAILLITMLVVYKLVKSRDSAYMKPLFFSCLLFFTYASARSLNDFTTSRGYFHDVPRHTVMTFTKGQWGYVISDAKFQIDTLAYNFRLKNYFITHGITHVSYYALPDKSITQPLRVSLPRHSIYFDARVPSNEKNWGVLRQKQFPRMGTFAYMPYSHFILSPELGFKTKAQWLKLLQQSGNQVTDPSESGAVRVP